MNLRGTKTYDPRLDAIVTDLVRELQNRNYVEIKDMINPVRYYRAVYKAAARRGIRLKFSTLEQSVFVRKA